MKDISLRSASDGEIERIGMRTLVQNFVTEDELKFDEATTELGHVDGEFNLLKTSEFRVARRLFAGEDFCPFSVVEEYSDGLQAIEIGSYSGGPVHQVTGHPSSTSRGIEEILSSAIKGTELNTNLVKFRHE